MGVVLESRQKAWKSLSKCGLRSLVLTTAARVLLRFDPLSLVVRSADVVTLGEGIVFSLLGRHILAGEVFLRSFARDLGFNR